MSAGPSNGRASKKKIWVLGMGTRGEIQPLVALALALQRSGLDVTVMSNTNHEPFVADFGLPFVPVCFDFSVTVEDPDFKAAMANNALPKTLAIINREFEEKQGPFIAAFDEMLAGSSPAAGGRPDLILYTLGLFQLAWLAAGKHGVPILPADFQPRPFRTRLAPPPGHGLPSLPCGLNVLYSKLFSRVFWHMVVSKQGSLVARNAGGFDPISMVGYANWEVEFTGRASHPYLCGCSDLMKELYPPGDVIPKNFHLTGPWVIPAQEQISLGRKASFGDEDMLQKLEAFMEKSNPVYIGWGSMLCKSPEYMVRTAVGALMRSKLKGVLLGGWPGLSFEMLEMALAECTDDGVSESTLTYARENILFVEQAPHEWMFPRVSAIVHHGGAGTTAASLRSGRPTVVTPLGGDQPMHGQWVQSLGAGLCTKGLDQVTAAELGDALLRVTSDSEIAKRAKEVGRQMAGEDGTAKAAAIVTAHLDVLAQDCSTNLGIK